MSSNNPFMSLPDGDGQQTSPQQQPVSNNPFMSLPNGDAPPPKQESNTMADTKEKDSWWNDKVTIMNHAFEQYGLGFMQIMNGAVKHTAGNLPLIGPAIKHSSEALDANIEHVKKQGYGAVSGDQRYEAAKANTPSPYWDATSQILSHVAVTAPFGSGASAFGKGAGVIADFASQGLAQGVGSGLLDYSDSAGDRLHKMAVSGTVGTLAGTLAGVVSKIGSSNYIQKVFSPQKAALSKKAEDIVIDAGGNVDDAIAKIKAVQAAEGIQGRTPGEALGGLQTSSQEAAMLADAPNKALAMQKLQASQSGTVKKIYDTVDNMAGPSSTPEQLAIKTKYAEKLAETSSKKAMKGEQWVDDVFPAVFGTKGQQSKFIEDVTTTGGNPEQAASLIKMADSLRGSPLKSIVKRVVDDGTGDVAQYVTPIGALQKIINTATGLKRYKQALVDITLSGDKWGDDIVQFLSKNKPPPINPDNLSMWGKFSSFMLNHMKEAKDVGVGAAASAVSAGTMAAGRSMTNQ